MSQDFYQTDRALAEYLLFHYGAPEQALPYTFGPSSALNFPARCVTECLDVERLPSRSRALDLGCAVGRSSFELARFCERVLGVDYSRRFVEAAECLKRDGSLPFRYVEEGALTTQAIAAVPADIDRQRVTFEAGDAQNLRPGLGEFDVLLMANLIDRLNDPLLCLRRLPGLLRSRGQLILTSPYTWLTEYTPKENWLGGYECEGRRIATLDTLKRVLEPAFEFYFRRDLPFVIREHARKFQWCVAEASVWIKR